jgi:hypothetical protein
MRSIRMEDRRRRYGVRVAQVTLLTPTRYPQDLGYSNRSRRSSLSSLRMATTSWK